MQDRTIIRHFNKWTEFTILFFLQNLSILIEVILFFYVIHCIGIQSSFYDIKIFLKPIIKFKCYLFLLVIHPHSICMFYYFIIILSFLACIFVLFACFYDSLVSSFAVYSKVNLKFIILNVWRTWNVPLYWRSKHESVLYECGHPHSQLICTKYLVSVRKKCIFLIFFSLKKIYF